MDQPLNPQALKVLVVDDNTDSADTMSKLLYLCGYRVQTAYDGPSAIDLAKSGCPDAVLLDIGLPGIDGYQVAAELQQHCPQALVFAITGYGPQYAPEQNQKARFTAYLLKPVEPAVILKMLEAALLLRKLPAES